MSALLPRAASSAQRCGAAALRIPSFALARFRRIPLARLSFFCALHPGPLGSIRFVALGLPGVRAWGCGNGNGFGNGFGNA
jgi:hypothetical protein